MARSRIIKRVALDEEGRLVCPRCKGRDYRVDNYSSAGNGLIRMVYSCSCGARFAVTKHAHYIGSPYLDRWPKESGEVQVTHAPEPPKRRRRKKRG